MYKFESSEEKMTFFSDFLIKNKEGLYKYLTRLTITGVCVYALIFKKLEDKAKYNINVNNLK